VSPLTTLPASDKRREIDFESSFRNRSGGGCPKGGVRSEAFELDGLRTNEHFLEIIRTGDIRTIHSPDATLDQVFNDVTGVRLREVE
jgi:hypothetical protein